MAALFGVLAGVLLVGLAYFVGREDGHSEGFSRGLAIGARMAEAGPKPEGEEGTAIRRRFDHLRTDTCNLEDRRD